MLFLAGFGLVTVHRHQLVANLDTSLRQRATDIESLITSDDEVPAELSGSNGPAFAQLIAPTGEVLASTANMIGRPALFANMPLEGDAVQTIDYLPIEVGQFRVLSRPITTPRGPARLVVGASLREVSESTSVLATSLLLAIPVAVVALGVVVWLLVGRTLRPVERIRSEVAAIGAAQLDQRVRVPSGNDEISRLAWTMNEMLDRLETSAERQRRFVADASHELRSPLTRMRAELEVERRSSGPDDTPRIDDSLLEEVLGLQQLVEDLLELARADAGESVGRVEPVDLDDIVLREAQNLFASGRLHLDVSRVSGAHVVGDAAQLSRAVRNLLDNAARHASSSVTLSLSEDSREAVFVVTDDGPGIPIAVQERIFERFERVDRARSQAAGGTGLGLAITREIVERHGGTVGVDPVHLQGARFVMRIPAA